MQSTPRDTASSMLGESIREVPRITILTGRFGTGKTEVAVNYALYLAGHHGSVTLTDMDVVTPYYRCRDLGDHLENEGVEVVAPPQITKNIHLPAISAEIWGTLQNLNGLTVMDVGGDSQGSRAIGQFKPLIEQSGYIMYLVVNPYRPFNATVERIAQTLEDIEANTRLRAGALVSNPNLISETTLETVQQGHALVKRASEELGLPIAFMCVEDRILADVMQEEYRHPILPLRRHFRPPWEE
jgi:hypothetical protein